MRRWVPIAAGLLLVGCQGVSPPAEAVLSLVPTAMQVSGLTAPAANDPNTACLIAGASVTANIQVARAPITIIVIAFTPTPATIPGFELSLDAEQVAAGVISTVAPKVLAYNVALAPGDHTLRVGMPGRSPGILCVQQVAVTQR